MKRFAEIFKGESSSITMKMILVAMCFMSGSYSAHADDSSPSSASAYQFLNITSAAKAFGLGGINVSTIGAGIDMIDQNPALLGPEIGSAASVNYSRYFGDSNFAGAKFGHRINERSAYAVGLQYYGYGSFDGYDEFGVSTGSFTAQDVNFYGVYSHDFTNRLRGGATLKMIYSGYESYSAFAIATDLGLNYYDDEHDLSLSVVITNLGGQVKRFTDSYDRLPVDVRLGWSQQIGSFPVRWNITAWNLTKWNLPYYETGDGSVEIKKKNNFGSNLFRHLIFGADIVPSEKFYLSVGYNYKTRTDMSTYNRNFFSGIYLGAGINVNMFGINLAFAQPHNGGTTLMLNLSTDLSKFLKL